MSIKNRSLSGKKIKASDKNMTFAEKLYLPAIVKGMALTFRHLWKKKATVQYPEQKRYYSPVYRGEHVLMRDNEGRERCTACGLCALACPAEAITMVASERKADEINLYREEKYARIYEINMIRCIFCGLCEDACPKEAIFLTKSRRHVLPEVNREDFIYDKKRLLISIEDGISGKYDKIIDERADLSPDKNRK